MREKLIGPVVAGLCVAVIAAGGPACASTAPAAKSGAARASSGSTGRPPEFAYPDAVAVRGNRVWVANSDDSVTEINAVTGALIRIVSGRQYGFNAPVAITTTPGAVWIVNIGSANPAGSVTEISASTGALIRVISARRYQLIDPAAIAASRSTVWVANGGDGLGPGGYSVTEISASTGALIRVISARRYRLFQPTGVAIARNAVWVANESSVTEINAATGALIRVISARRYRLTGLVGISATGNAIWAAINADGGEYQTVTEINAATGALIRVGSSASLPAFAFAMTSDPYGAWLLTNSVGGKGGGIPDGILADFSARTGALARTLSPPILKNSNGGGGITAAAGAVWVVGSSFYNGASWLAEFSAATGKLIRQIISR